MALLRINHFYIQRFFDPVSEISVNAYLIIGSRITKSYLLNELSMLIKILTRQNQFII